MTRVEPFDDLKVSVKRGEVDWLSSARCLSGRSFGLSCTARRGWRRVVSMSMGARQVSTPMGQRDHKLTILEWEQRDLGSGWMGVRQGVEQLDQGPFDG